MSRTESENAPVVFALGMVFIMLALACAIAIGNGVLVISSFTQFNIIIIGGFLLVISSLSGGYLTSSWLLFILRDSRKANGGSQK